MKLLKPSPVLGKNDFDMSHRVINSLNFGECMPCLCLETVPDSKYTIRPADLIRPLPLVTSPFMRAKQHVDVWFVPYNALWSRFNEFMVDRDEPNSSAFKSRAFVPHISMKDLLSNIDVENTDIVGQDFKTGACRLLDALGYPSAHMFFGDTPLYEAPDLKVNLWRLLAYNFIWYKEYRQQYYDDGSYLSYGNPACFWNVDALACDTEANADLAQHATAHAWIRQLCQMRYRCWNKDLFTGLLPSTQFGNVSVVDIGSITGLTAAFTGTQLPITLTGSNSSSVSLPDSAVSVDPNGLEFTDPSFNTNVGSTGSLAYKAIAIQDRESFRRVTAEIDASVYNGQSYEARKIAGISGLAPGGTLHSGDIPVSVSGTYTPQGTVSLSGGTGSLGFDILNLRHKEAIQLWRENALRAGNQVEDNFMAHYGTKPFSHMHSHPVHIGSVDAPLNIGDIEATASTGSGANEQLGDIAGKGMSTLNDGNFHFQTNEFGVIMGIVSVLPETEYMSLGVDRMNQLLEREDYYIPEYAKLGLQPVSSATFQMIDNPFNLGYAPRDYGYKQKLDTIHLDFFNMAGMQGVFRAWASPKYDVATALDSQTILPLSCLYVNPKLFDVNFGVSVDNSRQFLADMYFDVEQIAPMPVSGMPSY